MICRLRESLIYRLLREVRRPGRYFSNDVNLPLKQDAGLRFLLCFPDLYEIGMSNLGLRMLYHVLNRHPGIMADVAFAPWADMEAFMRSTGESLTGIGTARPANCTPMRLASGPQRKAWAGVRRLAPRWAS